MYDELQDSYPTYREWRIKELIMPYCYDEYWGHGYSGFDGRHQKRMWTDVNDKVGDFRCWKRYRKTQYKWVLARDG